MLNIDLETLITPEEAADKLSRLLGRKIKTRTVYVWAWRGLKGVRLESAKIAGRIHTTWEAVQRFIARTNPCDDAEGSDGPADEPTISAQPGRISVATRKALARHGLHV